jgi:AGZA family xanthine/uracil permease-like MFS transporter
VAWLRNFFELDARGSTVGREFRGAVATFLTMAYILFVNPRILADAGVPQDSTVACTAAAAGLCCILMGIVANFPIALASGMGLNAFVAYTLARPDQAGSWQAAMGIIVVEGLLILLLVLAGLREAIMHAIPRDLRLAIGAGIGLFVAFIGLQHAGLVVDHPATLVTFGSLRTPTTAVAAVGVVIAAALIARRVPGALVISIVATTAIAFAWDATWGGIGVLEQWPPTFAAPSFEAAFQADVRGALQWRLAPLILSVMMVDFFDTLGTVTAVGEQAGLVDASGRVPRVRRILVIDSLSASIGGSFGASSVTSYVESAAGVAEGARTGLHSVFVGLLFLLAIFAAPLAAVVPAAATAPALILVGFLMIAQMAKVDFARFDTAIPAFVTLVTIPLTFSISHGIGYGFVALVLIKLLSGKPREVHPLMYATAAAFAAWFVWGK